jgi:hypothetical protein
MSKRFVALVLVFCVVLVSVSCAPGNDRWDQTMNPGDRAGFWAGIWHGLIIIITFVVSLFTRDVGIYEVNNTGWPYNLGFIIGLCFSFLAPWRVKFWKWGRKH